ncbi:MAG TPA: hypothetical protein VG148_13585 [Pyrinomonadaceae bacterium]|nr:hypothetical protein [Pyrinomonadaceae bacterium]
MTHPDLQPHSLSAQAEAAVRGRPAQPDDPAHAFFDSMVMYGWLADRQQRVTRINKSLRDWMVTNGHGPLAERIEDGVAVPIAEFFGTILRDDPDKRDTTIQEIVESVESKVKEIIEYVEGLDPATAVAEADKVEKSGSEEPIGKYFVQRTVQILEPDRTVLAGLRVVKTGAIRMNSRNERDRVDIITVCQVALEGGRWRVKGLQGQLQQAWIRVRATIEAGTEAGTVGLMGRNMSHNIGSHALFYMEVEEPCEEKQRFYRYLRERMELLAGFSTGLSLSATTESLKKVVGYFTMNTALLERIAKSEGVRSVDVKFRHDGDLEVALPAGVLGAQALYTILENNIRDSAKHGRGQGPARESLTINIDVREPQGQDEDGNDLKDEFIEVVVSDDRGNYAEASRHLDEAFGRLRIADELGKLEPGNWGIKERFISAALLRGIRLQSISVQQDRDKRDHPVNMILSAYKPEILRVTDVDGSLGWAFYMMKPKEILLITGSGGEGYAGITVRDMDWLRRNIEEPSAVRHKFVVVRAASQGEVEDLRRLEDKLPHRLFVSAPEGAALPADSNFVPIEEECLHPSRLSAPLLYSRWVEWLVRQKKQRLKSHAPVLRRLGAWFSGDEKFIMPEVVFAGATRLKILSYDDSSQTFQWEAVEKQQYQRPKRPVVLFDRHGTCKKAAGDGTSWEADSATLASYAVHYEPHEGEDAARQLDIAAEGQTDSPTFGFECTEAALIKILIVDERLDPVSRSTKEADLYTAHTSGWKCTKNELFHWKGVDIKGGEYGEGGESGPKELPDEEVLIGWVDKKGYDFLVLHKGIVDKLIKNAATAAAVDSEKAMRALFARLKEHVRQLVIHTGRMSWKDLPEGCKFMALSNVDTWLRNNYSKVQIIEDICLLRRV